MPNYSHIIWGPPYEEPKIIDDETTEVNLRITSLGMKIIGDGLVPGHHLGILQVNTQGESQGNPGPY
jgi:hypothetical protein